MYYCTFEKWFGTSGKIIFIIPIGGFIMYVLMYNLASTADDYLSPSLEYITVKFGLSESFAGVTLLAFGNGAPDIFSAIAATSDSSDSADVQTQNQLLSISANVGSTLFISTVVMLLTSRAEKPSR
jgi:sodium/potassium/calcium exchanger 6